MSQSRYPELQRALARNVRHRRITLGLTQEAVAHASGMATRHYQKLEAGELNITLRTLCQVAQALDQEVFELVSEQETPLVGSLPPG